MKTLTVSIAAYNAEAYICQTLNSLIESGCLEDLQVIVVDDGSTDNTAAIARDFSDHYPESIKLVSKSNGGYGSTINCAIKIANGKYFRLLDSDDWLDAGALRVVLSHLKQTDVDIVLCNYCRFYEDNGKVEVEKVLDISENLTCPICDLHEFNLNPAMIVKTAIIKNSGYSITEHCFYTDIEYCAIAVTRAKNCFYLPVNLYFYRIGRQGQSISVKQKVKHIDDHDLMVRKTTEILLQSNNGISCKNALCKMLMGHIVSFSIYVKPNISNLKKFISYCNFVKATAPETAELLQEKYLRIFTWPKIFYIPVLFEYELIHKMSSIKRSMFKLITSRGKEKAS